MKFTAEDFKGMATSDIGGIPMIAIHHAAQEANALLPALIEAEINRRLSEANTVYGRVLLNKSWWGNDKFECEEDTHKAKLLAVTLINEKWPWEGK